MRKKERKERVRQVAAGCSGEASLVKNNKKEPLFALLRMTNKKRGAEFSKLIATLEYLALAAPFYNSSS